jgi:muramoyltetrapeptide carboxypeptidase
MSNPLRVGILATSSCVPQVELHMGIQLLQDAGFQTLVHENCSKQSFTFAGADQERAQALWDLAIDDSIDILWCARGGYGATRLLPILHDLTNRHRPPKKKLLIGYSDVTVLHEFFRAHWNWSTLHAVMPAAHGFLQCPPQQWAATISAIRHQPNIEPWSPHRLEFIANPPSTPIEAPLIGGTLTLWAALCGTPHQPSAQNKILFFEDLAETWYRIDRMVTQLLQAGAFDGARAIVLGDFKDCNDENTLVRKAHDSNEKIPLRRVYSQRECMQETFGHLANKLNIPIALSLPVGHGPNFWPLPLGAEYRLSREGSLRLISWSWKL